MTATAGDPPSTVEAQRVAATEEILGQFLGDESFPVTWDSEVEKDFFWVYDDLHIPHPVSPMFFDIGGWWLCCDHMFRRFGTPFAVDWLAKNVNGYVYTTAIPADPDLRIEGTEYSSSYGARVPRDATFGGQMGKYLDTVLPVYGEHFADWWRDRLVPEMQRNFDYLEGASTRPTDVAAGARDAARGRDRHPRPPLEDPLDAQLRPAVGDAQPAGGHGEGPRRRRRGAAGAAAELGVGPQLGLDRSAVADEERGPGRPGAAAGVRGRRREGDRGASAASERGRRFIDERIEPYQREFGWHAVWSHEFIFPTVREEMEPVLELVRGYLDTDYDYPTAIDAMRRTSRRRRGDPRRASRRGARGDARRQRDQPADGAAHPDHHFYIDQGANAHVRLVLIAIGRKLVEDGRLDQPDDVLFLRYNELRMLIGDPAAIDARGIVGAARAERDAREAGQAAQLGRDGTPSQLAFPYLVNWGYPERFYQEASADDAGSTASPARRAWSRALPGSS